MKKYIITREDMLNMIRGTGGPGTYVHPFKNIGQLTGFPNERWEWNDKYLESLTDLQLDDLYSALLKFKKR